MSNHITLELLRQVHAGEREASDLAAGALGHLLEICPDCRQAAEDWAALATHEEARPFRANNDVSQTNAPAGMGPLAHLMLHKPLEWADAVRLAPGTYASPGLAELLLSTIPTMLPAHVSRTSEIAGLAGLILSHCGSTPQNSALYALSVAFQANADRVHGRLKEGQCLMEAARFILASIPSTECVDPLITARLDSLDGSLKTSQRHLQSSASLHLRSVDTFLRFGSTTDAAKGLISLITVCESSRDLGLAGKCVHEIRCLLDREDVPIRVRYLAEAARASTLNWCGRAKDARALFERIEPLYREGGVDGSRPRRKWLEGSLCEAEGRLREAEACLREARDNFESLQRTMGAAVVGKVLARLLATQGRIREAEELIDEVIPFFEAQEVHFEADAARKILRDALAGRRDVN